MKQSKTTLVIIYNHNYEANIERLEQIYRDKFDKIFHLMPFYQGNKPNVIKVYGSSYHFADFVRQGLEKFKNDESSHYCFAADDLLINPEYNQYNITEKLGLDTESGFIPRISVIDYLILLTWPWAYASLLGMEKNPGYEYQRFIPSIPDAIEMLKKHNLTKPQITRAAFKQIQKYFVQDSSNYYPKLFKPKAEFCACRRAKRIRMQIMRLIFHLRIQFNKEIQTNYLGKTNNFAYYYIDKLICKTDKNTESQPTYPLCNAFSDFFIIPHSKIDAFANIVGVLSAANVFVEVAVPTAMALTLDKIVTQDKANVFPTILWGQDRTEFAETHKYSLKNLNDDFGNTLFIHPIKLSQWGEK